MLVELDPAITTTVHNHVAHELPLVLLAAKGDSLSYIDSLINYLHIVNNYLAFNLAFNCLNLVATVGGFSWMRTQLAPLQLDMLKRATKDTTLTCASDADHLTLTLTVPNLLNPSKDEFSTTCKNNIVTIVWSRGEAMMAWTEPVPLGKKLAKEPDFALDIAPRMKTTQCTFSTSLLDA